MVHRDFANAALMLIGHGSTQNADSGAPVFQHAAELRRRRIFARVVEGFWKQEPRLTEVLPRLTEPKVFIVPLFISEGYFSENIIPNSLGFSLEQPTGRVRLQGAQAQLYCRPVGSHESMTNVLLARASQVIENFPFPRAPKARDITLFIAGHGTEKDQQSRQAVDQQVNRIRERGVYAAVEPIFLEEEPRIASCYQTAQTKNIVIVPFFMSDGLHVREDIPAMLGQPERTVKQRLERGQATWRNPTEKNGKLVWLASSVGTEPGLAEVILELAQEAEGWKTETGGLNPKVARGSKIE